MPNAVISPTIVGRFGFGFGAANRIKYEQRDFGLADGFQYDATDQIIGNQRDGTLDVGTGMVSSAVASNLQFDCAGNRTQITGTFEHNIYTRNKLNQYAQDAAGPAGSVSNGIEHEIAGYQGISYGYRNDGRLASVSGNGSSYALAYDALGRCVKRTLNGTTIYYTYDGPHPIYEWKADGTRAGLNLYGQGIDEILLRADYQVLSNGQGYFFQQNRLGSVTHLTGFSGETIESYRYDAFGTPTITSTWGIFNNRFKFTGREYQSAFGIYEYRARAYHPGLGRFLSEDPMGFGGGDTNLFRYCGGDPVNSTDPSGLFIGVVMKVHLNGIIPGTTNEVVPGMPQGPFTFTSPASGNPGFSSGASSGMATGAAGLGGIAAGFGGLGGPGFGGGDRGTSRGPGGGGNGTLGNAVNLGSGERGGGGEGPRARVILGGNVAQPGVPGFFTNDDLRKNGERAAGLTTFDLTPNANGTVTLTVDSRVRAEIAAAYPEVIKLEWQHVHLATFWMRQMNRTGKYASPMMKQFGNAPWDLKTAEDIREFLQPAYQDMLFDQNWLDRDGGPHDRDYFK